MSRIEFAGIEVGMTADDAIKLLKPRGVMALRSGWIGKNEFGLIGKWVFDDGTVITLERTKFPGPYQVTEIEFGMYALEEIEKLDLQTTNPNYKPEPVQELEPVEVMEVEVTDVKKKRKRRKAEHG